MHLDVALDVSVSEAINNHMTRCPLIPPSQGWALDLIEATGPVIVNYKCHHPQICVLLEGEVRMKQSRIEQTFYPGQHKHMLNQSEYLCIVQEKAYIASLKIASLDSKLKKTLEEAYYESYTQAEGYNVYDLKSGANQAWSIALLEIQDSPKHYHKVEREIFLVVEGELSITLNQESKNLSAGESIMISPGVIHKLTSANSNFVKVLCFSFPAFNPEDMWIVN